MRLIAGVVIGFVLIVSIYTEYSAEGRLCRSKGGVPYVEGCFKMEMKKVEVK